MDSQKPSSPGLLHRLVARRGRCPAADRLEAVSMSLLW